MLVVGFGGATAAGAALAAARSSGSRCEPGTPVSVVPCRVGSASAGSAVAIVGPGTLVGTAACMRFRYGGRLGQLWAMGLLEHPSDRHARFRHGMYLVATGAVNATQWHRAGSTAACALPHHDRPTEQGAQEEVSMDGSQHSYRRAWHLQAARGHQSNPLAFAAGSGSMLRLAGS